jgi:hypothetical protein
MLPIRRNGSPALHESSQKLAPSPYPSPDSAGEGVKPQTLLSPTRRASLIVAYFWQRSMKILMTQRVTAPYGAIRFAIAPYLIALPLLPTQLLPKETLFRILTTLRAFRFLLADPV